VKEAYLEGQIDSRYKEIIKSVSSIIFLSTPHRGSNMPETLHKIFGVTNINYRTKYLEDLVPRSQVLQSLNDRFRHVASNLQIVSFYETLPTAIVMRKMVSNSVRS
jgi:hypothetical protein